jgi:hypothetical protein
MILAERPIDEYEQHAVGDYNGSTAIPIAARWCITAAHTWTGTVVRINHEEYKVLERVQHPWADLALLRVDRKLPRWYPPRKSGVNEPSAESLMLGFGRTGVVGGPWGFPRLPLVGTNRVELVGTWVASTFDADGGPHEAQFAENDSGGGWVVNGELAAVAVSVSRSGRSEFGDASYGIALWPHIEWIEYHTLDEDGDGDVDVDDIFSFLDTWLGMRGPVQRFFDYLNRWFRGRKPI